MNSNFQRQTENLHVTQGVPMVRQLSVLASVQLLTNGLEEDI